MLRHLTTARRLGLNAPSRAFAAAAAQATPIPKATGAFGRYATGLYGAALKNGVLDTVASDVEAMQEMQSSSAAFDTFLNNPTLPRSAKVSALEAVVKKADFSPTFSNFLMVVAENGRTAKLESILKSFSAMIASTKGEVTLKVTSHAPLSAWELALLQKQIRARYFEGQEADFTLETAVDEELLGGFTVMIGDRFMDMSTKTELRKLCDIIDVVG